MYVRTNLSLERETRSGTIVAPIEVSGEVTPDCTHPGCACLYTVVLDAETKRLLWSAAEVERAETALGDRWIALHPYGLDALEAA